MRLLLLPPCQEEENHSLCVCVCAYEKGDIRALVALNRGQSKVKVYASAELNANIFFRVQVPVYCRKGRTFLLPSHPLLAGQRKEGGYFKGPFTIILCRHKTGGPKQ